MQIVRALPAILLLAASAMKGQQPTSPIEIPRAASEDTLQVVGIERLRSDLPNSVGGVDVLLTWSNLSPTKTVKYATFMLAPFNRVDDAVASEIGGTVLQSVRVVGPIPPGQKSDELRWKNVWYNSTIARVQL